jgi:hypothetical protein
VSTLPAGPTLVSILDFAGPPPAPRSPNKISTAISFRPNGRGNYRSVHHAGQIKTPA